VEITMYTNTDTLQTLAKKRDENSPYTPTEYTLLKETKLKKKVKEKLKLERVLRRSIRKKSFASLTPAQKRELQTDGAVIYGLLTKKCPGENLLFRPSDQDIAILDPILQKKKASKARQLVVDKLGSALVKVYTIYRLQFDSRYICWEKYRELAREAAALCFQRGVTPAQLISYWAEEVTKFTKMDFPSLAFLCLEKMIEEVAACVPLAWEPEGKAKLASAARTPVPAKHAASVTRDSLSSFGKYEELDPRIRPGLTEAGFDVSMFDDRYLHTIQINGRGYSNDPGMFVLGETATLVKWVARNIYG